MKSRICVTLARGVVRKVDNAAEAGGRTRSSFIEGVLQGALGDRGVTERIARQLAAAARAETVQMKLNQSEKTE